MVGCGAGETQLRGVLAAPFPAVLHTFEAFTGLGKLEHSIVAVDPVGQVFVLTEVLPVPSARSAALWCRRAWATSLGWASLPSG